MKESCADRFYALFVSNSIVSQGIIDAVNDDKITKPIVVRMKGTGSEEAAKVVSATFSPKSSLTMSLDTDSDFCLLRSLR